MSRSAALAAAPGTPRPLRAAGALGLLQRGLYHLLSFEMVFASYVCSNQLKLLFPPLPFNETLVFLALSIVVGGVILLRDGIYVRSVPILAACLLMFVWMTVSWGWSPSRRAAGNTLTLLFTLSTWAILAGGFIMAPSRERVRRFLVIMMVYAIIIAIAGLTVYIRYGTFKFADEFSGEGRVYLSWGYTAANGALMAFAWLIFSRMFSLQQMIAGALFALCMAFVLVGSGRGPLLSVVAGCGIAVLAGLPRLRRGRIEIPRWQIMAIVGILAGTGYIVYLVVSGAHLETFGRFQRLFQQFQSPDLVEGRNRFSYFAAAIRLWLRAPVLGNGISSFPWLFEAKDLGTGYAHNILLELLSEQGLVGLALYLLVLWQGLRLVRLKPGQLDPLQLCVLMLFVGRFMTAMTSYMLWEHWLLLFWCSLLAIRPAPDAVPPPQRAVPTRLRYRSR